MRKYLILLFIMFIAGCSQKYVSRYENNYETTIKISVDSLKTWNKEIDDNNYFNISGVITVPSSPGYNYKEMKLKTIEVLENDKPVFYINPISKEFLKNDAKKIIFSTLRGLRTNQVKNDSKYNFYFILNDNSDNFGYYLNGKK